jgi:hypothetical protein
MFALEVSSNISVKDFYEMVWRVIPHKIALQSLDILREDSEQPLPITTFRLVPEQDEIFSVFIQTVHYTLQLDMRADAFHNDILYQAFDIVVQESHTETEETKHNPPSIPPSNLPIDQDGNRIAPSYRYNYYSIRFFVKMDEDENGNVTHQFYSATNIEVLNRGRFGDEWTIDMPDDKQSLYQLTDILHDGWGFSDRTLHKLSELLQLKWNEFLHISRGGDIEEVENLHAVYDYTTDQLEALGEWA